MANEIVLNVTANVAPATKAPQDELKASWTAFEKTFKPIDLKVNNPVNDAFLAQVRAGVKEISTMAAQIPVDADLLPFKAQVEEVVTQLNMTTKADIPVEMGDAFQFREQVLATVAQVSESTKAVIGIQVDDQGLTDLQAKTLGASQATVEMVAAEQKLNQALASGDDEAIAKARVDLVTATKAADGATTEMAAAQAAAAQEITQVDTATKKAGSSLRAFNEAMGPIWLAITAVQFAMMGFGSSSDKTAQSTQDMTQQITQLGQSAGSSLQGLVEGNQDLTKMAQGLTAVGSSAAQMSQAFSSVDSAKRYLTSLTDAQSKLSSQTVKFSNSDIAQLENALGEGGATIVTSTHTVGQLTDAVNRNHDAYNALPAPLKALVDLMNHYTDATKGTSQTLTELQAAAAVADQNLAAIGVTLSQGQKDWNNYGLTIQANAQLIEQAQSGSKYLEDSTDKATITAGQAVQQWQQLNETYQQSAAAVTQAGQAVGQAEHGVTTAAQGLASARHSEEQATLAVGAAQRSYTEALYQQKQAADAVTAAEKAAQEQMRSLQLQANDAATSVESANLSLFQSRQEASKYGVNSGNAAAIAAGPINAGNEAKVSAAVALLQAEEQVADAQNSSAQATDALNTARKQGVAGNPAVLAAEHALQQANQGVKDAAQGVKNAQYEQQQSAIAVKNAEYDLAQAHLAVGAAQRQETAATNALKTAQDNLSRSLDSQTVVGAQNRQMLENIYEAYLATGIGSQAAAEKTSNVATQMGFARDKVKSVTDALRGLDGTNVQFDVTGVPSLNPQQLDQAIKNLGVSPGGTQWVHVKASGGPASGLAWVGEQGPELVVLPTGSSVLPAANAESMAMTGQAPAFAAGGAVGTLDNPMSALAANFPLAGVWGGYAAVGNTVHAFGGPQLRLPPPGPLDMGPWAGGGAAGFGTGNSHVSGNRAANKAIMQQVFAGFGWGSGAQWAAQDYLEMREAGYNNLAQNPTSTAFGMGQFLDSTWGAYGYRKTSDPYIQSMAMAQYEKARYGDPIHAAAHERAVNWYANGGAAGGLAVVGERGKELVRTPAGQAGRGSGSQVHVSASLEVAPGANGGLATLLRELIRTGQLRLSVAGTQVVAP